MNGAPVSGWREHGTAFLLASCIVGAISVSTEILQPENVEVSTVLTLPLHGHVDTYAREPFLSSLLAGALSDGSSIVLFGSSELTTKDHPAKPVNFFNERLGRPLLAIGHDGNQCFAIHSQLISAGSELSKAKLAIMLSPSWFGGTPGRRGTELSCFLEYNPSPSLYRVHQRLMTGDTTTLPVPDYLVRHADDLSMASPVVKEIIARGSAWETAKHWFVRPYDALVVEGTRNGMLDTPSLSGAPVTGTDDSAIDWQALRAAALEEHVAECTNNRFSINDEYYSTYVNGSTRLLRPLEENDNQELRDLVVLLDHLKNMNADPLFVVQPVNPFVYADVRAFTATMDRVKAELDSRGFTYLDLWEDDTARFQPGVLTDAAHLGALGWYKVDSALMAHFR
ncbi:MAG: hypothetical protein IPJ76_17925 [Flavobacteriales bacterium]|nr:MAG: hypothetical protein IPJ76_17925 [Flavobacteriales bacterium]